MKYKAIGWAYPTSTNSARFKMRNTGCWTVETRDENCHYTYLSGHADPAEALRIVMKIEAPWCPMFLRHMAPDIAAIFPEDQRTAA